MSNSRDILRKGIVFFTVNAEGYWFDLICDVESQFEYPIIGTSAEWS